MTTAVSLPIISDAHWYPVALASELRKKPLARRLAGRALVIFRGDRGVAALPDRCPHRHAPLSQGKVRNGEIECPYHGWRFDSGGMCTRVPGLKPAEPRQLLTPIQVRESHGMIWATLGSAPAPIYGPNEGLPSPMSVGYVTTTVRSSVECAAENFLDGTHTHFVHAGWVRQDARRQNVHVDLRAGGDWVEARYTGEAGQAGLISRLLESNRTESRGRFRTPGIAEIEYCDARGVRLRITAYLTPETEHELRVHAVILTRKGLLPAPVSHWILSRVFAPVLQQDLKILELQHAHRDPNQPFIDTRADILGPWIRRLLAGESAAKADGMNLDLQL